MKKSFFYIIFFLLICTRLFSQNDTVIRQFEPYSFDRLLFDNIDSINKPLETQNPKIRRNKFLDSLETPFTSYRINTIPIQNYDYYKDTTIDLSNIILPHQSFTLNPIGATIPGAPLVSARFSQNYTNDFWFLNNYGPYIKSHDNVLFFDTHKPYTSIKFYSGGQQQEILQFLHTQNAGPYLNFAINYNLINWMGDLQHSKSKINALSLTSAYTKHKYQSHFDFIFNRITHFENAGLRYINTYESTNYPRNNYDINLNNASNRINQLGLRYNQEYKLGTYTIDTIFVEKDTIINKIIASKFSLIHEISGDKYNRLYKDANHHDFYKEFFKDSLATNDSTVFNTIKNKFALNFSFSNNGMIKEFKVLTGIKNDYNIYKYDFILDTSNNLAATKKSIPTKKSYLSNYIFANVRFDIGRVFVNSSLDYCFAGWNSFDTKFDINASYRINNDFYFNAFYKFSLLKPDIFVHQYRSNHFEWKNDKFKKSFKSNIYADLELKKWDLKAGVNASIINNYIVFNYISYPIQVDKPNLIVEAFINNTLKAHKFYWFNQLAYQHIKNKILLPLPAFIGYSKLYFKDDIFKKALQLQLGIDVEFRSASYAYSYMPAIGVFHLQETQITGNYPILGFNISFKVKNFRGFVKVNNILQAIDKSRSYNFYRNPYSPFSVNYGIAWEFFN